MVLVGTTTDTKLDIDPVRICCLSGCLPAVGYLSTSTVFRMCALRMKDE
jgi:hypothetical protein